MRRFGIYAEVPFPYPAAYQSDGAGGLVPIPFIRIPTAVLQAAGVSMDGRAPASGCGGKCACHGACGGCKRLQRGKSRGGLFRKRLRGLGDGFDFGDGSSGGGQTLCPDGSLPGPDGTCGGGVQFVCPDGSLPGPNGICGGSPSPGGGQIVCPPGTVLQNGVCVTPGSVATPGGVPGLINSIANAAGKLYASTAGVSPQQTAPRVNATPAGAGTGLSTLVGGFPIWQWGLGLLAVGLAVRGMGGR
jgi:hypothetical protein